jgi:hypothetical protein
MRLCPLHFTTCLNKYLCNLKHAASPGLIVLKFCDSGVLVLLYLDIIRCMFFKYPIYKITVSLNIIKFTASRRLVPSHLQEEVSKVPTVRGPLNKDNLMKKRGKCWNLYFFNFYD